MKLSLLVKFKRKKNQIAYLKNLFLSFEECFFMALLSSLGLAKD